MFDLFGSGSKGKKVDKFKLVLTDTKKIIITDTKKLLVVKLGA